MEAFSQWVIILIGTILLSRVVALLARRFDLPGISIQLLAGILLGPSAFNVLRVPIVLGTWGTPSSGPLQSAFKILAEIGLIQLMFLAGLVMDWRELKKAIKFSFSIGAWAFGLTATGAAILTRLFVDRWPEALAMSSILSASSFGISIYYLNEMKILGSRVAVMVSGAALLSGLFAILMMIASQAANYAAIHGALKMTVAVSWFLAKLVMFFAVAYFLTSRFLRLASKSGFHKRPHQMLIGYLLLVAALYAWGAMHFGSFAAVGIASLGGALLGVSNLEVKERIAKGFESILASIPIGILLIVIGMELNLKVAGTPLIFLALLVCIVVAARLIGCRIATDGGCQSPRERAIILFGVLPQGEIGILVAAYLFSRGALSPLSFHVGIAAIVLVTMVTPVLIKIACTEFIVQKASIPISNSHKSHLSRGRLKGTCCREVEK